MSDGDGDGLAVSAVGLARTLRRRRLLAATVTPVLSEVSFGLGWGATLGVAGPTGAGKTTLLALLGGLVRPSGGTLEVAGVDMVRHPRQVRRHVGMVIGPIAVDPQLSPREDLAFHAACQRLARRSRAAAIDAVLELTNLADRQGARGSVLTPGERRRLVLARALLADPPLLLLDDPAADLDTDGQHDLWDLLANLGAMNKTIVLAVSRVIDIEQVCTHALILGAGRAQAFGTLEQVRATHPDGLTGATLAAAHAGAGTGP